MLSLGRLCNELRLFFFMAVRRNSQTQGEKVFECSIRSYSRVIAVTEQKAVLSIELFEAEGNFE